MTQDEIIEIAIQGHSSIRDAIRWAINHEREQCKKLCEWKTGNQFVDEAVAVCYRAIDLRGKND